MEAYCPHCKAEISDEIFDDWQNSFCPTDFDFECPDCNKKLKIEWNQMQPSFNCHKPNEEEHKV